MYRNRSAVLVAAGSVRSGVRGPPPARSSGPFSAGRVAEAAVDGLGVIDWSELRLTRAIALGTSTLPGKLSAVPGQSPIVEELH